MKKLISILFYLFIVNNVSSQNFEGKIIYENNCKSKLPNVTDQQFNSMLGTKQEYYIKNGNYKSLTNGTFSQWQLYINSDNKLYSKFSNSEGVIWNDAMIQEDEILDMKITKNVIEILGQKCDELVLICKSGIQKYYYNSKQSVDAELFKNHKYGNWFDYISKSNSLPLKIIIDNAQFTIESTANEIKQMKLDDNFFELPKGIISTKKPY